MSKIIAIFFAFEFMFGFIPITDKAIVEQINTKYDLKAQVVERGIAIRLPNSNFRLGSYTPGQDTIHKIGGIAELFVLNNINAKHILVEGHTDSSGDESFNIRLGLKRAESIATILKDKGIAANRVHIESKGSKHPISTIDELNRRVQILIYNP